MSIQPSEMMINNNNAGVCRPATASGQVDVGMLRHGEKGKGMFNRFLLIAFLLFLVLSVDIGMVQAATVILRPDGVSSTGTWTGVTAANLNDQSDATVASQAGALSTFVVTMGNSANYVGATIDSIDIYVRGTATGTGGGERFDFGPTAVSGTVVTMTRTTYNDYTKNFTGFTPATVDSLTIAVATTTIGAGEILDISDIWAVVNYTMPLPTVQWTAASQSSANETNGTTMTVTAQLSATSASTVTVPFTVTGSATGGGTDYTITASPITINAGNTTGTATITIVGDTKDEVNETVILTMGTPTNADLGATTVHTATITDDDNPPTVQWTAANQASANETNGTTMIVTAQLSAVSGLNVSVPFTVTGSATGGGTDYTITASPIAINAGSTTGTATITIVGDVLSEGNETVILTIGTPTNATASGTTVHTATITDDDGPVCTQNPMTITVTPATQNVRAGFAITYTVMVTNNDSVECSPLTVNLGLVDNPVTPTSNFALSTLSAASKVIAPQTSSNVTLTVTAQPAGVETSTLTSTVTASATGHANQSDAAVSTIMNYNPMIHSSKSTNSTKWAGNGGWGIAGGKYGEFTCATCHEKGTGNIKRVKTSIETPDTDPWVGSNTQTVAVTLSATTGANSYGNDGRATLTSSNMVCEVCHSATTVHRYNSSTGVTDFNHMSANQTDCISCHAHNQGFDASCTTCHGYPPVDAGTLVIVTSRPTGSTTAGAHNTHVATFSISCAICHYNSDGSGATHNVNGQVSLGFVNLPTGTGGVSSGSYNGQGTVTYNSTDAGTTVSSGGTKTCTNYCHGSTIGAAGAVWDNPATGECGDCHGAAVATPPSRVNHPRHVGTAAGQLGLTCDKCHGPGYAGGLAPGGHLSGSVTYDVSGLTGNTPTYRGFSTVQQTGALAPSGTYGNCGNMYCHSNVQSANGTAAASIYATPTWGAASVACDSCHGQAGRGNGQPGTGSHEIHVTTRGYACSACHAGAGDETAVHANGQINISMSGGGTYTQGTHAPGAGGYGTCSSVACHNGKTTPTWGATGTCISCHTVDGPNSATVANPVSGLHSNTVASVQDHDNTLPGGCEACHVKASITGHWNGVASATADYTKAQVGITAAWYTDAGGTGVNRGTCTSTCHLLDNGAWARQWSTAADSSVTTAGDARCAVCHGQFGDWRIGTSHYNTFNGAASTRGSSHNSLTGAANACEDCHSYPTLIANHENGSVTVNQGSYVVTRVTGRTYCSVCHTNDGAPTTSGTHTYTTSALALQTVAGANDPVGDCSGCHGGGTTGTNSKNFWPDNSTAHAANQPGKHNKHVTVIARRLYNLDLPGLLNDATSADKQKAICEYCHAATTNDSDHTSTYPADVFDTSLGKRAKHLTGTADADATYSAAADTCSNIDCHNSKLTTDGTFGWYDAGTSTCVMCHSVGAGNNPNSGLHTTTAPTVSGAAGQHDDAFGTGGTCTTCHSALLSLTTTQINTHINAAFTGDTVANLGLNAELAYAQSAANVGTCFGSGGGTLTSCHSDVVDQRTWKRVWNSTVSNGSGGAECAGCHGGFGTNDWTFGSDNAVGDFNVSHNRNWDSPQDGVSEVIGNHTGSTQATKCSSCHVYGDAEYLWGTYHRDNRITMNSTMGYSGTTFNCTTHCHSDNNLHNLEAASSAAWATRGNTVAGPAMSCTTCHSGSGGGGLNVGSASPHVIVGTRAGYNTFTGCETCHPQHTGGVLVPNETRVGINYTADARTGFRLGGTMTSGTTEAQICWNCHGNLTYQTTAISEWAANNKQPGMPVAVTAYNWGTLTATPGGTGNWVGATWTSAQSTLFSYKTGAIQSTHAANFAATTPGADTVGTIRCSFCHDVHDTYGTTGKPYLRGTWWTNPYREDGAPVSSITYTGVAPFGNVPRASSTQNQLGGFQIDQNNASPTATGGTGAGGAWTVADSASLCWLCHNKNKAGTNVTVDTLDWFGTNDWVTNGSGQINGHSNAVVGGTGSNKVNIFRSSWRTPSMGLTTTGARPDMGYKNHGTGVGYGYRAVDARGFNGHQPATNDPSSRPYGGSFYSWGATVDDTTTDTKYHNFSCSKCHNPHASRLPRLMVTNCLDTKKNTWDNVRAGITALSVAGDTNSNGVTLSATTAPDSWGRTWSNVQSAQNCHRLGDAAQTGYGKGWNNVTPW